jgi:hypothetical protein
MTTSTVRAGAPGVTGIRRVLRNAQQTPQGHAVAVVRTHFPRQSVAFSKASLFISVFYYQEMQFFGFCNYKRDAVSPYRNCIHLWNRHLRE